MALQRRGSIERRSSSSPKPSYLEVGRDYLPPSPEEANHNVTLLSAEKGERFTTSTKRKYLHWVLVEKNESLTDTPITGFIPVNCLTSDGKDYLRRDLSHHIGVSIVSS